MKRRSILAMAAASPFVALRAGHAAEMDKVRIAITNKGLWDTTLPYFGQNQGIFAKHGIEPDFVWTGGGADQLEAVIAGAVELATACGILGVVSAYSKGAPVEIISAEMMGASDIYFYALASSGLHSWQDLNGKTVGYDRPGGTSNLLAIALTEASGVKAKLVPAGSPGAVLTQVMSGQLDVGWSGVPFSLDLIRSGKLVRLATGNDAPGIATQTIRVNVANRRFAETKPDVLPRFIAALRETQDWAYSGDTALKEYAALNQIDLDAARAARDGSYPRQAVALWPIQSLDLTFRQAVESRRLAKPMAPAEVDKMLATARNLVGS